MVQSLAPGPPRGNDQVPSTRARPEPLFTPRRRIRQIRCGSPSSSPDIGSGHPLSDRHLANRGLHALISDGSPGVRVLP